MGSEGPYREAPYSAPSSDHDLLVRLSVQMEEVHLAVMGNGKPGLISDVGKLNTKMAFMQWLGSAVVVTVLGIVARLLTA